MTFLLTDIEDSSTSWERSPVAMRAALSAHDALVAEVVASHRGVVVKHLGDGCWAAFSSTSDAVEAAIEFQRRHQRERGGLAAGGALALAVRIGLHTGDVEPTGDDYFGPTINRLARVTDFANGDQIVCSAATAALVREVDVRSEGLHELRGIGAEEVFTVRADDVLHDPSPLRLPVTPNNLPRPRTSFVGRTSDLDRTVAELAGGAPLVTLVGPGGVGKTRLAVEVAHRSAERFGERTYFCDLVPVADGEAVVEAVADVVGARRQPDMDLAASITDHLAGRSTLLVLDNCEHVLASVRELVEPLLAADGLQLVCTSREPLAVAGEQAVIVSPLPAGGAAVELFVDRAQHRDPRFELTAANEEAVRTVVHRLDGIPLAIELAAARIRVMSPAQLAERLADGVDVLSRNRRGDRHETLRNTVRWSYDLLDPAEAKMFERLSVFAGGFDLDAAEEVCLPDGSDADDAMELLLALVDKSMVESVELDGHQRFSMLVTLGAFAREQLAAGGDDEARRHRHARHYLEVARRQNGRIFSAAEPDAWRILDLEWANLRTAFDIFVAAGDVDEAAELVVALVWFASMSMRFELFGWAEELLERPGIEAHVRFTDLCGAAAVGSYFTVDGLVTERAEAGLTADPSDPEGFCRCALASVFLNNVHTAEASDELTSAWLDSEPATIGGRLWANAFRTLHLVSHDPTPEAAERAAAVADIAASTGSVTARALEAWANGQVVSFTDLDRGVEIWREGREWAQSLPARHLVDELLVGLILHVTVRRGELASVLRGCRDGIGQARDQHYYAGMSHLFGVTAIALSRAGDAPTGARLVGSMLGRGHMPRRNARRELEVALGDELDVLLDDGRGLTVTEAGDLAIEALDAAIIAASS
ncbi:MAG: adenylate/guanylate cyclase domain-containing protein [Actinomycetota bacterium]